MSQVSAYGANDTQFLVDSLLGDTVVCSCNPEDREDQVA